ncbi:family 2 encapsulin nanocompartment cargo protein terpene cyclase [Streptomyces sp. P9(2023)]|uniref:family 2 encapsulin nanocompartment cargo protein terpene cyclase n=1 Tax=Streptomyces sp. P9(2023) TaxID=3064394 RepID=UPI0028F4587B|nr:family 2 encapsulin nanocompartment cargo protein terpene cyclase [Streptomyces sp. P9(2023)]MDT9689084.1 family 2 encapsulin nanocompartment cargo protein terpene cyclase [Streptomyces sp. P9(2023)]
MSAISRLSRTREAAALVDAVLADPGRPARPDLLGAPPPPASALPYGPTGLGTSAARVLIPQPATSGAAPASGTPPPKGVPTLYCPPAVRDDPALGELVNERLVLWAEEVGIYPGHLDKVRSANFGRLMMLGHPESDDPDMLLAAAKCGLAEWAVDDHIVDCEVEEPHHEVLGQRLALCHAVIDRAQLPLRYAPQLEREVNADPVARALRSALDNLLAYASTTQVRRLRHELAIMFVAYNQEGVWRTTGQRPPVWEYLMHRHENSFVPCMVLVDAVAGYEVPQAEFADPRVRRAFNLAGTATVLMNDLYSMAKEDPTDVSLPMLIAAEERCSLEEAVTRSVEIHDELMHTFEAEASALARAGSPRLSRFLAGTWAWVGGNREWHAGSARYRTAD